jgi:hypothetical protein
LWIDSREYRRGRLITWLSCTILALVALVPVVQRRMRRA